MSIECPNCGGQMIWIAENEWYYCHDCHHIEQESD